MYRVTTPKHTFSLPEDSSGYLKIEVTYRQANKDKVYKLVKLCEDGVCSPGMTLDGKDVIIELSQEETKKFAPGKSILGTIGTTEGLYAVGIDSNGQLCVKIE